MKPYSRSNYLDSPIKALPSRRRERGILKPKKLTYTKGVNTKQTSSILGKVSDFFNKYSLSAYENKIDVSDLENSYKERIGVNSEPQSILKRTRFEPVESVGTDPRGYLEEKYRGLNEGKFKSNQEKFRLNDSEKYRELRSQRYQNESEKYQGLNESINTPHTRSYNEQLKQNELENELKLEITNLNNKISQVHKDNETLTNDNNQLIRHMKQLETELSEIKVQLDTKTNDFNHINERNYSLVKQAVDMTKELELLHKTNKSIIEETKLLKQDTLDTNELRLKLNSSNYLLGCKTLELEYLKYNLIKDPKFEVSYYKLAHEKLLGCEVEFRNYKLFKQDKLYIENHYNYEKLVGLKIALNKLKADLQMRFDRRVEKSLIKYGNYNDNPKMLSSTVINHLSCIHKLKLKIIKMLHTIDEIIIILNA